MDRTVDRAVEQGLFDLLGEQRLAAHFQQAAVLDAVAGGGDQHDRRDGVRLRRIGVKGLDDGGLDLARLNLGEGGGAGADTDRGWLHGEEPDAYLDSQAAVV